MPRTTERVVWRENCKRLVCAGRKMSGHVRKSNKSVRPLGAVRQPIQTFERVGRMPPFNYNKTINPDYEIQGNAMQVIHL